MKLYTVKQLADLSGVSVRTLHHYDAVGLLRPACLGGNGYRYYGQEELLRLQQILFHRELGVPLREIARLLDREGSDRIAALAAHRARLEAAVGRYRRLIETIDRTMEHLRGERTMDHADLYKGFSEERQAGYEAWLVERFGPAMRPEIERGRAAFAALAEEGKAARMEALAAMEGALAEACRRGVPVDDPVLDPLLARHREWVAGMWGRPCPPEAYAGLADLYLSHPDFRTRYETLAPGFTDFLAAAMKAHAERAGSA
ncbi:MAG TPA: MerR family transcriptional regulator [Azospirillaceae bacterium]|nr:MerR family transcriptional regulator [Azospirillaceae bacterium]